ncbi:saccharopine dehydrogenase [Streptomyces sp. 549]|uniref:NAD-dependent epimerase/dehydratase family protein n=1 Tax=Streptomyces sp. 549 TaxID=3049076 RepID=UPI0024C3FC68|nr:NAD-dependent epimerase/dehydratase family protein [Streptomyces sp. 549]MDK1474850.1 saccharopine dehydrogenase [Streptomyces sp. 549]
MRVLVLGGYGAVGSRVVTLLREQGHKALAAGRDAAKADRVVDLRAPDTAATSLRGALADVDVVVNASGVEDPGLVATASREGVAFVDITAGSAYVAAVERLDPAAPVVLSVGLAPGLTGLLATEVHRISPGPIDLALVLGAGERHGPAATDWSYDLLGRRFPDTHGGPPVRNFTRPQTFDLPDLGRRRLYRADFSDQHTLTRELGVPVRTFFALDSTPATAVLPLLTRLPGGRRAPRGLHLPGTDRWWALARAADGSVRWARGRLQSQATAVLTVLAVRNAVGLPPGVHHSPAFLTLADLPEDSGITCGP